VLEESVGILPDPSIRRSPRGLNERDVPVFRAEHPQQRFRVGRPRSDLDIERLMNQTALNGPEGGEFEDQILKGHDRS